MRRLKAADPPYRNTVLDTLPHPQRHADLAHRGLDVSPRVGVAGRVGISGQLDVDALQGLARASHPGVGLGLGERLRSIRGEPRAVAAVGPAAVGEATATGRRGVRELADRLLDRSHGSDAMALVVVVEPRE